MVIKKEDYWDRDIAATVHRREPYISEFTKAHIVQTPHGYVIATIHIWPQSVHRRAITVLDFAFNGRLYTRSWQREWRPRTITTLAREFVADVVERPFDQ